MTSCTPPQARGDAPGGEGRSRTDAVGRRRTVPVSDRPVFSANWHIGVTEGPHAAPEFFTEEDIRAFYDAEWKVHFNSARTGVRLVGPKPRWARTDGGEAGLHPSNIHDTPYSVGAVDYTGDMPVLLGPDGPSLGGFVCPATIVTGQRWKLGQLRPGDTVRFVPVTTGTAAASAPLPRGRTGRRPAGRRGRRHPGSRSRRPVPARRRRQRPGRVRRDAARPGAADADPRARRGGAGRGSAGRHRSDARNPLAPDPVRPRCARPARPAAAC